MQALLFAATVALTASIASAYEPATTQDAWENHFSAFGSQNVTQILLDYDDNSVVLVHYTGQDDEGNLAAYRGVDEIGGMFTDLFATLSDTSDLAAPMLDVNDDGMVFLAWTAEASGLDQVADTFIFDDDKVTIKYQTIVISPAEEDDFYDRKARAKKRVLYDPATYVDAWDNHFSAFGSKNTTQIMLDYDDNSEVRLFDFENPSNPPTTLVGPEAIEQFFIDLFAELDYSCLDAPVIHNDEENLTFLVWENPCTGYEYFADTMHYVDNKIRFQNIAFAKKAVEGAEVDVTLDDAEGDDTTVGAANPNVDSDGLDPVNPNVPDTASTDSAAPKEGAIAAAVGVALVVAALL